MSEVILEKGVRLDYQEKEVKYIVLYLWICWVCGWLSFALLIGFVPFLAFPVA